MICASKCRTLHSESQRSNISDNGYVLDLLRTNRLSTHLQAFISYMRSVHIQKDKTIFKLSELPAEEYAASMGLPGAPQIKLLDAAKSKAKARGPAVQEEVVEVQPSREVVGSDESDDEDEEEESEEEASDEDGDESEDSESDDGAVKVSKVRLSTPNDIA